MKKYDNFCKALTNLKEVKNYDGSYGIIELTGMVGLFEICFEQAWKAMKELLEKDGYMSYKTGSPKQIIKGAYETNLINDEEVWLSALEDRNNIAHSYNEDIAYDIVKNIRDKYYDMFQLLKTNIDDNWME